MLIAVLVRSGGLWHAAKSETYDRGEAKTLCGHWGVVDHRAGKDSIPVEAILEDGRIGEQGVQVVECIRCRAIAEGGKS
jgi:hypothetical protein